MPVEGGRATTAETAAIAAETAMDEGLIRHGRSEPEALQLLARWRV
jgi:hypothetical protein